MGCKDSTLGFSAFEFSLSLVSDFRRVSEALRFALVVNASFKEAAEPVKELGPVLLTLSFLSDSLTLSHSKDACTAES